MPRPGPPDTPAPASSQARTPPAPRRDRRRRDRRVALHDFLAFLCAGLHPDRDPRELRLRFEQGMQKILPVRSLALRQGTLTTRVRPTGAELLSLEVPGPTTDAVRIEALFDPARGFDDWDLQLLDLARYLAALVIELERARPAAPARRGRFLESFPLVGSSAAIKALRERIARVAVTDFTVLIEGESGSGKELVARHIHELSRRSHGPFVAVNCAAIVESLLEAELFGIEERTATGVRGRRGKFELADEGTLFLDEVSDLSPSAQAKLLRTIQDLSVERVGGSGFRRLNTRIVVATNRTLTSLVEEGRFRADLYYRLNGVEVHVPPLRSRREDVQELAHHFLDRHRHTRLLKLSAGALDALIAHDWPGNVRELERVMERAVALACTDEIGAEDLPAPIVRGYADVLMPALEKGDTMRLWASRYARLVLERNKNNKRKAARMLGISYHTLRAYLNYRPKEAKEQR
jgi:DNA-binding NtrC family response regulator